MGVEGKWISKNWRETKQYSQQVLLDCVVEDSESAKQKSKQWQPGSAQAQFGIKDAQKNFLFRKILWGSFNHHSWWGCQY
ncbi:hypothetical protein H6G06_10195 [Anabaena sphaerica FACHB-251]|uniref:Uncharacterized protein n=1 Tax=Anabaena sphaerica FACHB-251 TaxID=2692883 RepID=A0A927A1T9_9NOST|nr:hypothetical protein [Anabaena sphaerica]MBD2293855.1 hypothetical protein [Anabaena sphaerica FACHB-251]